MFWLQYIYISYVMYVMLCMKYIYTCTYKDAYIKNLYLCIQVFIWYVMLWYGIEGFVCIYEYEYM